MMRLSCSTPCIETMDHQDRTHISPCYTYTAAFKKQRQKERNLQLENNELGIILKILGTLVSRKHLLPSNIKHAGAKGLENLE
uniref:Uncharacterized protein n=1 Tax=Daphnia magna TaxID=35525 RepID=A0A0P5XYA3_9CRUS